MQASELSFRAAVLLGVAGMAWGIAMAVSQDHSAMPAHAHLNLLGWVSLFLFGLYYRTHPALDSRRIALAQVWAWLVGTVVLTVGVAAIHAGVEAAAPIAGIGSFIVIGSMLLFAVAVFRPTRLTSSAPAALAPAE